MIPDIEILISKTSQRIIDIENTDVIFEEIDHELY
jgi:hypothetical protein